jgi:hypothetical protein
VTVSFIIDLSLSYFFYVNVIGTIILSYIFFKRSKILSKALILTNMFILFYFLYPNIESFLYELMGTRSFFYILFYNIFIATVFIFFSGLHKTFLGDYKKLNVKILSFAIFISFFIGFAFFLIKEPVPPNFVNFSEPIFIALRGIIFSSFVVALSEQMIFLGFLYNTYTKLSSKKDSIYQVAVIFVMFHMLRFENLIAFYKANFGDLFMIFIILYYLFLFLFIMISIHFYTLKGKKYTGNFIYPLAIHMVADFTLFFMYYLRGYIV